MEYQFLPTRFLNHQSNLSWFSNIEATRCSRLFIVETSTSEYRFLEYVFGILVTVMKSFSGILYPILSWSLTANFSKPLSSKLEKIFSSCFVLFCFKSFVIMDVI